MAGHIMAKTILAGSAAVLSAAAATIVVLHFALAQKGQGYSVGTVKEK